MKAKLTPEEKLAAKEAKKLATQQARLAKKAAEAQARQAAWEAQQQAKKDAFQALLISQGMEADFMEAIKPIGFQDPHPFQLDRGPIKLLPKYESEFVESLATQYKSYGCLSVNQLNAIIKGYRAKKARFEEAAEWPTIAEGDKVKFMAKVFMVEQTQNSMGDNCWRIKMKAKYGRKFYIKTNSEKRLAIARDSMQADDPVCVEGEVGWVSPDGQIATLRGMGCKFEGLMA